jgi:PTS system cellobiose-specific IIC component
VKGENFMLNIVEKLLMPIAIKLGRNRVLLAIRDGFLITTPLIIVASLFLLFNNFPIPGWENFWAGLLGKGWQGWFANVSRAVFNMVGYLSCFGTAYAYGRALKTDAVQVAGSAMVAFIILTPTTINIKGGDPIVGLDMTYLGTDGIFLGIIVALVATRLYVFATKRGWTIHMPDGVPPAVTDSFAALIPSGLVILAFFFIRIGFSLTPFGTVHQFIFRILQTPLKGAGNTLTANIIYGLACTVFWSFGINGPAVANSVFGPVTKVLTMENLEAFQAGKHLPNIFTDPFSNFFTNFGGGGSTLSLVIVMVLFCKSERINKLGKLAIVPGFFGINEPIIFGLPVVLNPIILIPFNLVPLVNLLLSTLVTKLGWIPYTNGVALPWTTPVGFSGYLSTGSLIASVYQIGLLILGCAIYYPFVKMLDNQYLREEAGLPDEEVEMDSSDAHAMAHS